VQARNPSARNHNLKLSAYVGVQNSSAGSAGRRRDVSERLRYQPDAPYLADSPGSKDSTRVLSNVYKEAVKL
jgi:hypothetical protein